MQLSEVQFTDAESAIIVLLAGIFLVLIFFILRQNSFMDRHFNKLDYKLNELARTAHAQQDNFQRTR